MSVNVTVSVDLDDVLYELGPFDYPEVADYLRSKGCIILEKPQAPPVHGAITAQLPAQTFIELLCTKWGISYLTPKTEILELFKIKILEL